MTKYLSSILAVCIFSLAQVQAQSAVASFSLSPSSTIVQGTEDVYLSWAVSNSSPISAVTVRFTLPPYITVKPDTVINEQDTLTKYPVTWSRVGPNNIYVFSPVRADDNTTKCTILLYRNISRPETPISGTEGELLRIPLTIDWEAVPKDEELTITMTDECMVGFGGDSEIVLPYASINFTIPSTGSAGIPSVAEPDEAVEAQVYFLNQNLYVDSPVAERISVYSITGVLLCGFDKGAGASTSSAAGLGASTSSATSSATGLGGVLIVKGSSGWVKKLVIGN